MTTALERRSAGRLRFVLPPSRIADRPIERRGGARDDGLLLVADAAWGKITHRRMRALPDVLRPGDLLVVNDSATLPAAVPAADGSLIHLATNLPDGSWLIEVRVPCGAGSHPVPDVEAGQRFDLPDGVVVTAVAPFARTADGVRLWHSDVEPGVDRIAWLLRNGRPIRYGCGEQRWPLSDYQTVFSHVPGSAEMPSASRGFTERLVADLTAAGIEVVAVTLHTGVSSAEAGERPHPEWMSVGATAAARIRRARHDGGRVIAVGTTVVRALESAVDADGEVQPMTGWTGLIVTPERGAPSVDGLLTGWHEPEASHLDLIEAVAGRHILERSYAAAIAGPYLWHEFGDFHLVLR